MIYNETVEEARGKVIEYLKEKQFKRVLDIGGAMWPWAREVVTHYFDILNPHIYLKDSDLYDDNMKKSIYLHGDINDGYGWEEIKADVAANGLFDFVTCTQTLEDIRNPSFVIRSLPSIAKQGFISVPHKYRELTYVEGYDPIAQKEWGLNKPYIGYCHHRWIFSVIEKAGVKTLRLFPKLEFISCVVGIQELTKGKAVGNELSFWWDNDIPFELFNDDYLGPNPPTFFQLYVDHLSEGL